MGTLIHWKGAGLDNAPVLEQKSLNNYMIISSPHNVLNYTDGKKWTIWEVTAAIYILLSYLNQLSPSIWNNFFIYKYKDFSF